MDGKEYFMSNLVIRKLVLSLILTIGSLLTLPSFAWPEVDHMNMCGAAAKVSRTYAGNFKGWQSRDRYVAGKAQAGQYYRENCPRTFAPSNVAPAYKVVRKARKVRRYKRRSKYITKCRYVRKCTRVKRSKRKVSRKKRAKKYPRIARSSKARRFKRRVRYDKHADCVRVDRVNRAGSSD